MNNTTNNNNINNNNNNEKQHPFRIMTQNIQGLNSPSKREQIIQTMSTNNINVLGLSETKLTDKVSRLLYKKNENYIAYFNNDNSNPLGTGVSLIFSKLYARNIHKVEGYKGRLIYADLYFKGNTKLRIIQVYLHSSLSYIRRDIDDIHNILNRYVEDAQRHNFKIIVMGDFNRSPEKYHATYNATGHFHWKYQILQDLENKDLIDTIDLYQDINISNPFNTYISHNSNSSFTRIDLIWISRDIVLDTLNSNNF